MTEMTRILRTAGMAITLLVLTGCQATNLVTADSTNSEMAQTRTSQSTLMDQALGLTPPGIETRPVDIIQLGRTRTDSYAWLRDDNWQEVMRDPSVLQTDIRTMLEAENEHYEAVVAPLAELEERIFQEMRGRIKEDDSSVPSRDGQWFYYSRFREGGQYPIIARRPADSNGEISGEEVILFDGDAEAEPFDYFSLGGFEHSPDQRYAAWAVDTKGSEYYTIFIRDLETGEDIATLTDEGYGSLVWANDSRTVYWVWRDDNARPKRVYRQAINASEPELVYEEADDAFFINVERSDGDTWVMVETSGHTTSEVRLYDANDASAEPLLVAERREGIEYSLTETGNAMFILTNRDDAIASQFSSCGFSTGARMRKTGKRSSTIARVSTSPA